MPFRNLKYPLFDGRNLADDKWKPRESQEEISELPVPTAFFELAAI
jgi:hypothetical protein